MLRLDRGVLPEGASKEVRGAPAVVELGFRFSGDGWIARPALVNGGPGVVVTRDRLPFAVIGFTVGDRRIVAIDILADHERLRGLDLSVLDD